MLDRLMESKSRRSRSAIGVVTSVAAHLTIIVIAVHATAHSRPRAMPVPGEVIVPYVPRSPSTELRRSKATGNTTMSLPPTRYVRIVIDPKLPSIDYTQPSQTSPSDFTDPRIRASGSDDGGLIKSLSGTFNADQVERQVSLLAGAQPPSYPEALRAAGIEGKVIAQFIVDEQGRVEFESVRFVQSDNALFEASVRNALTRMRFAPAEIAGKKVRQLVQMPFVFTIAAR